MPPTLSKPSGFAPTALFFITVGALMTVWSGIWYTYLRDHAASQGTSSYICLGCFVTGIVLLGIGFAVGPMARWSRQAELPPTGGTGADAANEVEVVTTRRV
jgi:hypothetical protein